MGGSRLLVMATKNPGKVREMRELLADSGWRVVPLSDEVPTYEETGETFAANARGKAVFYAALTDRPTLADDSGLEIDALGGEPGVRSARYIDPEISQRRRNAAVLEKLADLPPERRGARFVCHLALAVPGRVVHETTGTCEGIIAPDPRGDGGFGYDPIFLLPDLDRTFAEIDRAEKSRRSHRGEAVRTMVEFLRDWEPEDPGGRVS